MAIDTAVASDTATDVILAITDSALEKVLEIRSAEDDPETLGLRVEITGSYGTDYTYDLAFETVADMAENHVHYSVGDLPVMIPNDSVDSLAGSTLDLPANSGQDGLVLRNPNKVDPLAGIDLNLEGSVSEKVQKLLEAAINPGLDAHGGFATLVGVDDETMNVYVTMGGGCQGCSMSQATLVDGIAATMKQAIPEINEVIDATDHSAGSNPFYE